MDPARSHYAVCRAVIKQGRHEIRCAFWSDHAARLAAFPVGAAVALMQVIALESHDGFVELHAARETQVTACPAPLAETVRAATNIAEDGDFFENGTFRHFVAWIRHQR